MPRRVILDEDTKRLVRGVLDECGVAGMARGIYYSFGVKVRSILNHGGGQAEIDNAIKYYLQRISDVNPNILRIIADKMQSKPTTEQC